MAPSSSTCRVCGGEFSPRNPRYPGGPRAYCYDCRDGKAAYRASPRRSFREDGNRVALHVCRWCLGTFTYGSGAHHRRYCSDRCHTSAERVRKGAERCYSCGGLFSRGASCGCPEAASRLRSFNVAVARRAGLTKGDLPCSRGHAKELLYWRAGGATRQRKGCRACDAEEWQRRAEARGGLPCLCGCGLYTTAPSGWRPRHNPDTPRPNPNPKKRKPRAIPYCLCGCGTRVTHLNTFTWGHNPLCRNGHDRRAWGGGPCRECVSATKARAKRRGLEASAALDAVLVEMGLPPMGVSWKKAQRVLREVEQGIGGASKTL